VWHPGVQAPQHGYQRDRMSVVHTGWAGRVDVAANDLY